MATQQREREILERSVHAIADRANDAYNLVEELHEAGFGRTDAPMMAAKRLRMELLQVKGDLERELLSWLLDCRRCNRRVHWVEGVGPERDGTNRGPEDYWWCAWGGSPRSARSGNADRPSRPALTRSS